ncbi:MAG: MurR/RpiR family transcriptional regulator, partial [Chloroflexi bacterium]|nr:MurR/RpiR family transcriptional regulator [Chloroflexota bacterium]
ITLVLRSLLPQLRPAERRVASFVIDNTDRSRHLTITELAEAVGVSVASVTRLTHAASCHGYAEFRRRLIEEVVRSHVQGLEPVQEETADPTTARSTEDIVEGVFRLSIQSLLETLQVLDVAAIERAADALAQAHTVYCFGIGSSSPIAVDAAYRLLRVGVAAHAEVDAHLQVARSAVLTSGDVVIAISFSGETQETLDAALIAKRSGATVIAITNFPRARLGRLANICLFTASRQPKWRQDAVPVRVVQLTLIDALCVCLMRRNTARAEGAVRLIQDALVCKGPRHQPDSSLSELPELRSQ